MNNATDMSRFGKVAVLMGGFSAEREISLLSGEEIYNSLKSQAVDAHRVVVDRDIFRPILQGNFSRVFIALHGRGGEDGMIQGALEAVEIPYTGSRITASAVAMDKLTTKKLWDEANLQTPKFVSIDPNKMPSEEKARLILARLGPSVFVKPTLEGSSVGTAKARTVEELLGALEIARDFGCRILVEHCIEGQEYTVAILDNQALPSILLETPRGFYDYQAKYHSSNTVYKCPSGLTEEEEKNLGEMSLKAFQEVGCSGWGRVDVMRGRSGRWNFLEVNTAPGMTAKSLLPMAAKQAGISFDSLVIRILETSMLAS